MIFCQMNDISVVSDGFGNMLKINLVRSPSLKALPFRVWASFWLKTETKMKTKTKLRQNQNEYGKQWCACVILVMEQAEN